MFTTKELILKHTAIGIPVDRWALFAVAQSTLHEVWAWEYEIRRKEDLRYLPKRCGDTFPIPNSALSNRDLRSVQGTLDDVGQEYEGSRRQIMLTRQEGLTATYNRFHDPAESAPDVQKLRDLHVEMDKAVAAAYGWDDLDLGHGFHETMQGTRFTISESARREVLARLLKLNHERYAEEVAQGLHQKKGGGGKTRKGKRGAGEGELSLFGDDDDDPDPAGGSGERGVGSGESEDDGESGTSESNLPTPHSPRPTPIDAIETDAVMAAFRQAARGHGWMDRDDLLKEVSLVLGYQRLGPRIEESLRNHLRAAIRRRIIEPDGPSLVHTGTATMADYELEELREAFRSVMRKGSTYEREDVIRALARYLGFVRLTETIRQPIKSAINSAIRQGILGYEGSVIWREA